MRILVYGINYAPELTGVGKYTGEMCEWLASQGHEVKVVCAPPYYPAWRVAEGYSATGYSRENLNGVTVMRCPLWIPARQSGIRRIMHLFSFAISTLPVVLGTALGWRPDVVFVLEPTFFCAPVALLAARLAGAKTWLHIQDLELDAAFALNLIRSRLLQRMVENAERFIMGMFDLVSSISSSMLAKIHAKRVSRGSTFCFPNWVDTKIIFPIQGDNHLRKEWGISPDSIVVLYSGNMGEKQGLEIVVEAARILSHDKRIQFVLSGDGSARQRLENLANGVASIKFTHLQPLERLNDLLNLADIHMLPQRSDVASLVMPSKLLGMLASARPVVATVAAGSELAPLVSRCGIVVLPGDAHALAEAIQLLADHPEMRVDLGATARELCVAQWDSRGVLTAFEKKLTQLCSGLPDA
ncbi:MAG: glycosyltransferase WbuB [Geobacteraceae bacterium]|nr:glycosyltransferase WbuB [Geobacteraceae bacterium]